MCTFDYTVPRTHSKVSAPHDEHSASHGVAFDLRQARAGDVAVVPLATEAMALAAFGVTALA